MSGSSNSNGSGSQQTNIKIKRPMNAWMLWSHRERKRRVEENSGTNMRELSKDLGIIWKSMSAEEKQPYYDEAARAADDLKRKHPDYKYQPKRKPKKTTNQSQQQPHQQLRPSGQWQLPTVANITGILIPVNHILLPFRSSPASQQNQQQYRPGFQSCVCRILLKRLEIPLPPGFVIQPLRPHPGSIIVVDPVTMITTSTARDSTISEESLLSFPDNVEISPSDSYWSWHGDESFRPRNFFLVGQSAWRWRRSNC